jgi:mono/diheme cytochrome c family protein
MRKVLKWIGIVLGSMIGLILIAAIVLYIDANIRINKTYTIQPETVIFPTDPASIERGGHLSAIYCAECHGDDYSGKTVFNNPPLGAISGLNLTPGEGGAGSEFTDANWVLAVRHGINPEGKPLLVMPSKDRYYLSDADFGDIIAYLKSLPPVNKKVDDPKLTPLGKILVAAGAFGDIISVETIDHTGPRPVAPPEGVTAMYGEYLVKSFGCTTCHGKNLSGGRDPNPAAPPAPDLTPGGDLGKWTDLNFINTIRGGIDPKQHKLTEFMPWKYLSHMTDDELKAVWLYLQSLPAK